MLALTLAQLCAREYNDVGYERIALDPTSAAVANQPNWRDWLNDAQRAIVLVRPDANAVTQNIILVAGTKQSVPATALRLLDVVRNMGADGLTPGDRIRLVDMRAKNRVNITWHTEADAAKVREVIYDDKKNPKVFYVSPPANGKRIEVVVSQPPTDVADPLAGNIALDDVYATPLQLWMLFRAYSLASQSSQNFQRAGSYLQAFRQELGVKMTGEIFTALASAGQMPHPAATVATYPYEHAQ